MLNPVFSTPLHVLVVFPLLMPLWAIGRIVTARLLRIPVPRRRPRSAAVEAREPCRTDCRKQSRGTRDNIDSVAEILRRRFEIHTSAAESSC
jgi:hypothetical protein